MTSPLLPYSVTFFPSSTVFMYPDVVQRGKWPDSYYKHRLGPGTYMVQLTYYSVGKRLDLELDGERLHRIEAGQTGWLKSPLSQIVVLEGQEAFLTLIANAAFGASAVEKAALTVYPMETYKP